MEVTNLLDVKTREEFREWLQNNHDNEKYCWIELCRKQTCNKILYLDAVEEALCFGWIDSTLKKLPDERTVQRFSPRSKSSNWTELNKERARRLERLGLMTDAGRKVLPDLDAEFVIDPVILKALKKDPDVYKNFLEFPELYRKVHIYNIHAALKANELEIFEKRLEKFITNTKQNKMYGSWNDSERLMNF